jgi:nucleotide-binding universal stress UspA family protein
MRWLISINGEERYEQAAVFAASLVNPAKDEVVLLGIQENGQNPELTHSLQRLEDLLGEVLIKRVLQTGDPVDLIEQATKSEKIDIVVYGSRGRRGLSRLILGSVAAYLEHHLVCSLLVVRNKPAPLKRILVTVTRSPESRKPVKVAGKIAQHADAEVSVLHVMSQLPLTDQARTAPLHMTAEEAIAHQTMEGQHLQQALEALAEMNVQSEAVLRYGLVLDEINNEIKEGDYQLLIIGAHRMPEDLPLANLLIEDMADMILMHTQCPVLIA